MGCDIHLYVEKKIEGKWVSADTWDGNEYEDGTKDVSADKSFYNDRNYELFSILAGVRNRFNLDPIIEPRGFPENASKELKNQYKKWDGDAHSTSWLTLQELIQFDWTKTANKSGFVSGDVYFEWLEHGEKYGQNPESYCQGTSTTIINRTEMDSRLEDIKKLTTDYLQLKLLVKNILGRIYCEVEWEQTYHRMCNYFWSECMPKLFRVGKPKDVRLVFWFDN